MKKPTYAVTSLSVARSGNSYTASWKVPSGAKKASSSRRFTSQRCLCELLMADGTKRTVQFAKGLETSATSRAVTIGRSSLAPNGAKVSAVSFTVYGHNSAGDGPKASASYSFNAPSAPSCSVEFKNTDDEPNRVKCSVSFPDSTGRNERYIGTLTTTRETNRAAERGTKPTKKTVVDNAATIASTSETGSKEYTRNITEANWSNLATLSEWVKYTFKATARGIKGDSSKESSIVLAWPDTPAITSVNVSAQSVRVCFNVHKDKSKAAYRPVSKVTLQKCVTDAASPSSWDDVTDATGGESCTALSVTRDDIRPNAGESVWFRIKAENHLGSSMATYSEPWEAVEMRRGTASGSASASVVSVLSVEPGADGVSLVATVAWSDNTAYNATEVSWSDDADAWRSTKTPSAYQMPDADWAEAATGQYGHKATVKVTGLEESTLYTVRARRYSTANTDERTAWSVPFEPVATGGTSAGVTATAPAIVAEGEPFDVSWVVGGTKAQTSWSLMVDGEAIAGRDGAESSWTVPASAVEGKASASITVAANVGGVSMVSEAVAVTIRKRPTVSITASQTITAKPMAFAISGDVCEAAVRVVACGVASATPDGMRTQEFGQVVWSGSVTVNGSTSVSVPWSAELIDGADYIIEAEPSSDGLAGDTATSGCVSVAWSHQAAAPSASVTVDAESMAATIAITAPTSAASTDVADVYRMSLFGAEMIAEGVAFGSSVIDEFAPFHSSEHCAYRIATRTNEGDIDWDDFEFSNRREAVEVVWPGGRVTLVHGLAVSGANKADFESVKYIDGTKAARWGAGPDGSISIRATVHRTREAETITALNRLAAYDGPAFVRTPAGHAFAAACSVESAEWGTTNAVSVTINAERIDADGFGAA